MSHYIFYNGDIYKRINTKKPQRCNFKEFISGMRNGGGLIYKPQTQIIYIIPNHNTKRNSEVSFVNKLDKIGLNTLGNVITINARYLTSKLQIMNAFNTIINIGRRDPDYFLRIPASISRIYPAQIEYNRVPFNVGPSAVSRIVPGILKQPGPQTQVVPQPTTLQPTIVPQTSPEAGTGEIPIPPPPPPLLPAAPPAGKDNRSGSETSLPESVKARIRGNPEYLINPTISERMKMNEEQRLFYEIVQPPQTTITFVDLNYDEIVKGVNEFFNARLDSNIQNAKVAYKKIVKELPSEYISYWNIEMFNSNFNDIYLEPKDLNPEELEKRNKNKTPEELQNQNKSLLFDFFHIKGDYFNSEYLFENYILTILYINSVSLLSKGSDENQLSEKFEKSLKILENKFLWNNFSNYLWELFDELEIARQQDNENDYNKYIKWIRCLISIYPNLFNYKFFSNQITINILTTLPWNIIITDNRNYKDFKQLYDFGYYPSEYMLFLLYFFLNNNFSHSIELDIWNYSDYSEMINKFFDSFTPESNETYTIINTPAPNIIRKLLVETLPLESQNVMINNQNENDYFNRMPQVNQNLYNFYLFMVEIGRFPSGNHYLFFMILESNSNSLGKISGREYLLYCFMIYILNFCKTEILTYNNIKKVLTNKTIDFNALYAYNNNILNLLVRRFLELENKYILTNNKINIYLLYYITYLTRDIFSGKNNILENDYASGINALLVEKFPNTDILNSKHFIYNANLDTILNYNFDLDIEDFIKEFPDLNPKNPLSIYKIIKGLYTRSTVILDKFATSSDNSNNKVKTFYINYTEKYNKYLQDVITLVTSKDKIKLEKYKNEKIMYINLGILINFKKMIKNQMYSLPLINYFNTTNDIISMSSNNLYGLCLIIEATRERFEQYIQQFTFKRINSSFDIDNIVPFINTLVSNINKLISKQYQNMIRYGIDSKVKIIEFNIKRLNSAKGIIFYLIPLAMLVVFYFYLLFFDIFVKMKPITCKWNNILEEMFNCIKNVNTSYNFYNNFVEYSDFDDTYRNYIAYTQNKKEYIKRSKENYINYAKKKLIDGAIEADKDNQTNKAAEIKKIVENNTHPEIKTLLNELDKRINDYIEYIIKEVNNKKSQNDNIVKYMKSKDYVNDKNFETVNEYITKYVQNFNNIKQQILSVSKNHRLLNDIIYGSDVERFFQRGIPMFNTETVFTNISPEIYEKCKATKISTTIPQISNTLNPVVPGLDLSNVNQTLTANERLNLLTEPTGPPPELTEEVAKEEIQSLRNKTLLKIRQQVEDSPRSNIELDSPKQSSPKQEPIIQHSSTATKTKQDFNKLLETFRQSSNGSNNSNNARKILAKMKEEGITGKFKLEIPKELREKGQKQLKQIGDQRSAEEYKKQESQEIKQSMIDRVNKSKSSADEDEDVEEWK